MAETKVVSQSVTLAIFKSLVQVRKIYSFKVMLAIISFRRELK